MNKPLRAVLDLLDDSVKDDQLVEMFHDFTKSFSEGGKQRMTIEVVGIFELGLKNHAGRFPKAEALIALKKVEHKSMMASVDKMLRELNS